jgi:hypothetical protein
MSNLVFASDVIGCGSTLPLQVEWRGTSHQQV